MKVTTTQFERDLVDLDGLRDTAEERKRALGMLYAEVAAAHALDGYVTINSRLEGGAQVVYVSAAARVPEHHLWFKRPCTRKMTIELQRAGRVVPEGDVVVYTAASPEPLLVRLSVLSDRARVGRLVLALTHALRGRGWSKVHRE